MASFNAICSICDLPLHSTNRPYDLLHPIKNNAHHSVQSHLAKHHSEAFSEVMNEVMSEGLLAGAILMRRYVRSERID